ncbi:MAG: thioredoxin [Eubacteriales bacterium]|nr:thioredoxin [Eubacteriales bacterium]
MASENLLKLTSSNFELEVEKSDIPVLVDFWAAWCGPCRAVGPVIEQLADDYNGKAKVGKVNVDEENELASRFRVMSIPTIILFKNGKAVDKIIGLTSKQEFAQMIDRNL